MATEFEVTALSGGLTFKLYRGEGVALLAFDLDPAQATDDFVGFSVEVQYPGSNRWGALKNRLHFDYPPSSDQPRSFSSVEAPFQKFRWIHVPTEVKQGEFRYRVAAGNIGINVGVAAPMAFFPFSGWKESFFGDLHGQGRHAVEFYTEAKVVVERWPSRS